MKMNIVDHANAEAKAVSVRNGTKTRPKWPILLLFLLSVTIGAGGCTGYYGTYPAYGPGYAGGPYERGYAGNGPYGPGYAGYPGSVTVEIGDRPYYSRGAGYYVGSSYYVWRPGHWTSRYGRRVWIHGHYVVR
ncbi:MAG TPA: hypothetical protein DIT76_09505 [Spartobacteria bacterium]|jgi:hypothetical protein|nr:hypothetical protein [Spartobacteria bacterium]